MSAKNFGFITDPLDQFDVDRETTLFFMWEAQKRGHRIFAFLSSAIFLNQQDVFANGVEIEILGIGQKPFYKVLRPVRQNLASLDVLFLRKDPPFDLLYLQHLQLLTLLSARVLMINDPAAILRHAEKITPLLFPGFAPKTCITSHFEECKRFVSAQKTAIVLKPLNSFGGRNVFCFDREDSNLKVAFEVLSEEGKQAVVVQEYLPEVKNGDKRILLLNGVRLGHFLRRPQKGDHRANLHSGGTLKKCALTALEKQIADEVALWCKAERLYFVGIDLIGERLTEINVTSPMGVRQVELTQGFAAETAVIDFAENRPFA